jgi:hypothetical protein
LISFLISSVEYTFLPAGYNQIYRALLPCTIQIE